MKIFLLCKNLLDLSYCYYICMYISVTKKYKMCFQHVNQIIMLGLYKLKKYRALHFYNSINVYHY